MDALRRAVGEMLAAEQADDWEAAEIVVCGRECWLGDRRISKATVNIGLLCCAFRSEGIGTNFERHTLNSIGRHLAKTGDLLSFAEANELAAPARKVGE